MHMTTACGRVSEKILLAMLADELLQYNTTSFDTSWEWRFCIDGFAAKDSPAARTFADRT
jgi:hypothetical protein